MTAQMAPGHAQPDRARMLRRGPGVPGTIEKARNPRGTLMRLVPYLRHHAAVLTVVLVLVLLSTLLGLIGPYLMGRAVDVTVSTRNTHALTVLALWMLGVFLLGNVADAASGWLMASVSQRALRVPSS